MGEQPTAPDLKPCPFCGAGAFISYDGDAECPEDWSANCENSIQCGAAVEGCKSDRAARDVWNTRATTPAPADSAENPLDRKSS